MSDSQLNATLTVLEAKTVNDPVVLRIYVANWSDDDVMLNRRFALGPPGGPADLTLDIVGPDRQAIPFQARIRLGAPTEDDFVPVAPYCGVGRDLTVDPGTYYDFSQPGTYEVIATWSNAPGQDSIQLDSVEFSLSP